MKFLPKHMRVHYGTLREFQQTKRADIREVKRALDRFRAGTAFAPIDHLGLDAASAWVNATILALRKTQDRKSKWGSERVRPNP